MVVPEVPKAVIAFIKALEADIANQRAILNKIENVKRARGADVTEKDLIEAEIRSTEVLTSAKIILSNENTINNLKTTYNL